MVFVREDIKEEELVNIPWRDIDDYKKPRLELPKFWVIDRDGDVFFWLIRSRMPGIPEDRFGISVKGAVLYIDAIMKPVEVLRDGQKFTEVYWTVVRLGGAGVSSLNLIEIKVIVTDAFECYGSIYRYPNISNVYTAFGF